MLYSLTRKEVTTIIGFFDLLRFSLLGSGSSGNAAYVASAHARVLIDNGLSYKQLCARLEFIGVDPRQIDAVFITHEHGDHCKGVGTLARKLDVPVFLTESTHASLAPQIGKLPRVTYFESGDKIKIADIEVGSFGISHDAADPVSFTLSCDGAKIGFATDIGHVTQLVRARLMGAHTLVLEANHCPEMLRKGSYPPQVQQRIRGRLGHLSNQDMCSLLSALLHDGLQRVVLIHLSETNNSHDIVMKLVTGVMNGHRAEIIVASQDTPTPLFEVVAS